MRSAARDPLTSAAAGEREIARVKARLQQQRDLDGIDTSNIIQGGRRRRAAAPVSYNKALMDPASEEEEDDEGASAASSDSGVGEGSEGAAGGSDSEGEEQSKSATRHATAKGAPAAAQQRKAAAATSDDGSSEEGAAGGSDSKPSSPAAGQAKSPDENQAARGNAGSIGKPVKGSGAHRASAGQTKTLPAASLEDSDGEEAAVQAAKGKRRAIAVWSDDE